MSESFNDFLHLFQTSNFCSIFLILADYGRTNILIKRLSIDQLSKRFTGNLILFCFVLFFFTSPCDWLRKHESSMAFLLQEPRKKANCVCSTINSRELLMFSLFCHGPFLIFTTPLPALSKNYELCKSAWIASPNTGFASYCPRALPAI